MQGGAVNDAQNSSSPSGQLLTSQVFFSAAEPNKSVNLSLVQTNPAGGKEHSARKFWHDTFDRYAGPGETREEGRQKDTAAEPQDGKREEEEKRTPPRRVEGLGDEAYWAMNSAGSALYVLKGEAFIRISVGGADTQEVKLQKSKTLAEKALHRF